MSEFDCSNNATYIPGGGIKPTGTIEITENGIFDVAQYANADVNVSGGGGDDSFAKLIDRSITNAEIPNGVTRIQWYAFYSCSSLASVTIPNSVTLINSNAFQSCTSLESVEIPNSVTLINLSAFNGCTKLKNVVIGTGIKTIGSEAFKGCSTLASITIKATTPPTLSNASAFNGTPNTMKIYVPSESVDAYKAANNWASYASKIYPIE